MPSPCRTRYREVFTPAVKKEILDSKGDRLHSSGLRTSATAAGWRGRAISHRKVRMRSSVSRWSTWSGSETDAGAGKLRLSFVCETKKHRIVIEDKASDGSARYRVWNRPKALTRGAGSRDQERQAGLGRQRGLRLPLLGVSRRLGRDDPRRRAGLRPRRRAGGRDRRSGGDQEGRYRAALVLLLARCVRNAIVFTGRSA